MNRWRSFLSTPFAAQSKTLVFLAGCALLVFLHLYRLAEIPGLHYDEAWAMNYSWRIASEPGFWPWAAMSPYTAPWTHYWGALFLKVLGPSLWAFRFSQVSLALAGLGFLCFALPRAMRTAFPFAVLLLPGLVLNHRFAIELTGLHVLAFGVMCFALSKRWWVLACVAALVGTTAHILFYGVVLGLLFAVVTQASSSLDDKKARVAFVAYFLLMAVFFLQVFFAIPEKGKAGALVLSAVGSAALLLVKGERWYVCRSVWWGRVLPVLAAAFIFNALFFGQGFWTASVMTGNDVWGFYQGSLSHFLAFLLSLFTLFAVTFISLKKLEGRLRVWLFASTFLIGIMMLKPAPRYFELVYLALTFSLTGLLSEYDFDYWIKKAVSVNFFRRLALWFALAFGLTFAINNAQESWARFSSPFTSVTDTSLRFLFFKDSSRDFLDKQSLVKFLGSSGCKFSDIETHDPRLKETLTALSLGDWKVEEKKACPYVYVARKTEEGASGEANGEFFLRKR